jgi:hypothetical protein
MRFFSDVSIVAWMVPCPPACLSEFGSAGSTSVSNGASEPLLTKLGQRLRYGDVPVGGRALTQCDVGSCLAEPMNQFRGTGDGGERGGAPTKVVEAQAAQPERPHPSQLWALTRVPSSAVAVPAKPKAQPDGVGPLACGNTGPGDRIRTSGLFVPCEAQTSLKGALPCPGQIPLSLLYLPCFAAVLAAERPSPFLVRASDLQEYWSG